MTNDDIEVVPGVREIEGVETKHCNSVHVSYTTGEDGNYYLAIIYEKDGKKVAYPLRLDVAQELVKMLLPLLARLVSQRKKRKSTLEEPETIN